MKSNYNWQMSWRRGGADNARRFHFSETPGGGATWWKPDRTGYAGSGFSLWRPG